MLNGKQLTSLHCGSAIDLIDVVRSSINLKHWLAGPIDDHMSNLIIAQLMYLESENPETPVGMLIQE